MRKFKRKLAQILSGVGAGIITATTIVPGVAGATETDNLFAHIGESLEVETGDVQEYVIGEDKVELETKSINKEDVYAVSYTEKTPVIEEKNISIEDGEVVGNTEEEEAEMALLSKGDGILDEEEETTIAAAIHKLQAAGKDVTYADVQSVVWTVENDEQVFPVNTVNTDVLKSVYASIEDGSVLEEIKEFDIASVGAASDKNDYVVFYYMPKVTEVEEETKPAEVTTEVTTEAETETTTEVTEEESVVEVETATATEQIILSETVDGTTVKVTANTNALPYGTKMTVTPLKGDELKKYIKDIEDKEGCIVLQATPMDIRFFTPEGIEIEPNEKVKVEFITPHIDGDEILLSHYSDEKKASIQEDVIIASNSEVTKLVFSTNDFSVYGPVTVSWQGSLISYYDAVQGVTHKYYTLNADGKNLYCVDFGKDMPNGQSLMAETFSDTEPSQHISDWYARYIATALYVYNEVLGGDSAETYKEIQALIWSIYDDHSIAVEGLDRSRMQGVLDDISAGKYDEYRNNMHYNGTIYYAEGASGIQRLLDLSYTYTPAPKNGYIRIQKHSTAQAAVDGGSDGQQYMGYSVEGAKFGIYRDENCTDLVTELSTGADSFTSSHQVPVGTYWVQEITAPAGHKGTGEKVKVDVAARETPFEGTDHNVDFTNEIETVSLQIKKESANPDVTNNNSNYSLAGAEFGLYNTKAKAESNTEPLAILTTDESGKTGVHNGLWNGVYYVKELKAPKGFELDNTVHEIKTNFEAEPIVYKVVDNETSEKLKIKKVSANPEITNGNDCYSLKDAEFGVYKSERDANQGKNAVATLKTDAKGETNSATLPMDTYYIKETKAPKGFKLNPEVKKVELKDKDETVTIADEPGTDPSRLELIKVDDKGEEMPGVPMSDAEFEIKYYANSKWEGTPVKTLTIKTDEKGKAKMTEELPAGTYTVQEKKAPAGYKVDSQIYKGSIKVLEDNSVKMDKLLQGKNALNAKDDNVFEIKNVRNPEVSTSAVDKNTGVRSGVVGNTIITDTVSYKNLYEGEKYTMKGTLMDKETGKPLTINGKTFVVEKEFTPSAPNGTVDLDFTLPTTSLAGKSTVVFEELIPTEGRPGAEHKDINDKKQEVKFPAVGTKAIDKNSTIQAGVNGKTTYVDTVSYTNLDVGSNYKVTGVLMDKETGKELQIAGKTVTGSQTFTPTAENGTVKVEFNLDATSLKGKSVVVFEKLFIVKKDGTEVEVGKHENINDGGQEIATPEIGTNAKDFQTKNHTAVIGETTLVDTVDYKNLIPNKKYTMTGTLMDKDTGKAVEVDGKKITKSVEFTPDKRNGKVEIEFKFDTSSLEGKDTVFYEKLFYNGVELTDHEVPTDEDQKIDFPKIRTTAIDGQTENHTGVTDVTTIVDTVKYTNLTVGQEYIMEGIVMDKATGKELKVNGKTVTATQKFTPKTQDGTVDVTFNIDASELKGKDVVVFETLYQGKLKITEHKSINDKGQTINYPEIKTRAINKETQNQTNTAVGKTTIMDTVSYKNLTVGQEYFLEGKLVDKATGEYIKDANGQEITSGKIPFTPDKPTGQTEIPIEIDTSVLQGKKIVVFEKLYQGEIEVTAHEDINDIPQNTEVPTLGTTATDLNTGNHTGVAEETTIVDEVKYAGLTIGQKYIVKGVLMDKTTGEPVVIDGKEIVSEQEFVVGEEVEYTHPSMTKEATDETVKDETKTDDTKADDTKTEDTKDTTDETKKDETTDKTDEVTDEVADEVVDENAYEPIESVTSDGTVKLFYDLNARELKGHQVVVFETLYQIPNDETPSEETTETPTEETPSEETTTTEPVKIISHEDIEDEGQTVDIPDAKTTATDKNTTTHTAVVGKTTIVDEVRFTGLTIGETYTFKGVLVDKETGEPLMQDGKEVTAEAELVAETKDGSQLLEFEVDTEVIAGRSVVAFEEVYYKDVMITDHKDLTDEDQTVNVPTIATTATGQNGKTVEYGSSATIIDTVTYTNLTVGESYVMSGTMVDQNGNAVSSVESVPFKAESANGTVDVKFVIDTTAHAGQKLVAFEELTAENGTKITEHKDLTDEAQTVYVDVPPEVPVAPSTPTPSTGNKSAIGIVAGIAGGAAVAAAGLALGKKRRREE